MNPKNVQELLKQEYIRDAKLTIDAMIKSVIGKLGENIKVNGFNRLTI
jgi:translation elongation factor EF-Ts